MPTQNQIKTIKKLAREGKSVNKIKEQLELPKSTVYYHFKKEVGQKQKENKLVMPEDPEVKGEISGVFAGDGNFYMGKNHHYRIQIILNNSENYWKELANFLEKKFEKKPQINHFEERTVTSLRYRSVDLYKFLKNNLHWEKQDKTGTICLGDKEFSKEFKIGFLRGLMDTDGSLSSTQRRFRFNTISKDLAEDTSSLLSDLGIENWESREPDKRENCRDMFRTHVTGKNAEKLLEEIEPRNPKKQSNKLISSKINVE